jgi:hypothetical protein
VKTADRVRAPLRYRNDAVFRSAERLLTAAPAIPARPRAPRWMIFSGGLVLGLALTAGLALRVRRAPVQIGAIVVSSAFEPETPPADRGANVRPASAPRANPLPAPTAAVPPAPTLTRSTLETAAAEAVATTNAARRAATANLPRTAAAANSPAAMPIVAIDGGPAVPAAVAEVTLRGELRSDTAAPVRVEFVLRRAGSAPAVNGFVRFFDGEARIAANAVTGAVSGNILSLRETQAVGSIAPGFPVGRQFIIFLPGNGAAPELRGSWLFGAARGTLSLAISAPW